MSHRSVRVLHCSSLSASFDSHGDAHSEKAAGESSVRPGSMCLWWYCLLHDTDLHLSLVSRPRPLPHSGSRLCSATGAARHRVTETSPSLSPFVYCQVRLPVGCVSACNAWSSPWGVRWSLVSVGVCSDKQELLPEDEHSSMESISVPESPKPDRAWGWSLERWILVFSVSRVKGRLSVK